MNKENPLMDINILLPPNEANQKSAGEAAPCESDKHFIVAEIQFV